ncbi:MAG TPA: hypothetical protein VGN81_37440 [Pseudonocardiaceae bacterium]
MLYGDGKEFAGSVTLNWPRALLTARRALAAHKSLADARDAVAALR